jgi:hypothetical protein
MPIIAVNLSPGVYDKVKALVEQGLYASPEQFLEISAFNQVALEQGLKPADIVTRGHRGIQDEGGAVRPTMRRSRVARPDRAAVRVARRQEAVRGARVAEVTDALARLSLAACENGQPAAARATVRPPFERLWGQVNRLFPLKFACRWLAIANAGKSAWERYDAISERMPTDAATLGSTLEEQDAGAGRKRDELLSTGLPRRGNLASVDRFMSQFIARATRSAEIYPGAICQYALAEFDGDRLALTDRGIDLACLRNPILDGDLGRAASTLSDEERAFFTHQVLQYVPGELRDIRHVLSAVLGGQSTPDDLLTTVRPFLPEEWSDVMARTHVSGLVARLTEMGLLRRRWEGRNVTYEAAGMASTLLLKEQTATHDQTD